MVLDRAAAAAGRVAAASAPTTAAGRHAIRLHDVTAAETVRQAWPSLLECMEETSAGRTTTWPDRARSRQDLPDRHHRHRSSYRAGKPENFDAKVPEIRGGPAW
jgi:hypothetical protein